MRGELTVDDHGRTVLRYKTASIDTTGIYDLIIGVGDDVHSIIPVTTHVLAVFEHDCFIDIFFRPDLEEAKVRQLDHKISAILNELSIAQCNAVLFATLRSKKGYWVNRTRCLRIDTSWIHVLTDGDRTEFVKLVDALNAVDDVTPVPGDKNPYRYQVNLKPDLDGDIAGTAKRIVFNLLCLVVTRRLREEAAGI
jgi:hypothetical protein